MRFVSDILYVIYNEICEYKDTEGNSTLLLLLYYLIQLCTGGAISPTSLPPGCKLLSVSQGDYFERVKGRIQQHRF